MTTRHEAEAPSWTSAIAVVAITYFDGIAARNIHLAIGRNTKYGQHILTK
jgi:hypothetical protein